MLALEMEKTQVKNFMAKLLKENLFDAFEARTIEILTTPRITIEAAAWNQTRPLVYEIIKLCPKPKQIKIFFAHANPQEIHTNAAALFLNLMYENDGITFTTATSQKEFSLEKTLNPAWDNFVRDFFSRADIKIFDRE